MKKYLLGAAALLAIAAPGFAHADDAGNFGAHYANLSPDGSPDIDVYGLDLGYTHNTDGGWAVQGTASSDRLDAGGSSVGVGYLALSLGTKMDGGGYYGWLSHDNLLVDAFGVGIGGQWNVLSQAVVNASVGYADFESIDGVTNVNLDGTWYFNDDLGIGAQVGYVDIDGGNYNTYGVNGVWRFTGSPIAVTAGWEQADGDAGDSDVWRIGFNWQFGSNSARENQTNGAGWNGAERQYQDILVGF